MCFLRLAHFVEDPVLFLELQIGQAPHRFRRETRFRSFLEKFSISLHRLIDPMVDLDLR